MRSVSKQSNGLRGKTPFMRMRASGRGFTISGIVPRRIIRAVEKFETTNRQPIGHYAAFGFLGMVVIYGLSEGGHLNGLQDRAATKAGLGIENIEIEGSSKTSELTILQALDLDEARSLVTLDALEIRASLEHLPWIKSAEVRKFYPDTLMVNVEERQPFAIWQLADELSLIDEDGVLLSAYDDQGSNLPLIVGHGANKQAAMILNSIAADPTLVDQVKAAIFVAGRRWNLRLDNGVTIKLPETAPEQALVRFSELNTVHNLLDRDLVEVDLRLPDRLAIRLTPESADERRAENEKIGKRLARLGAPI